MGPSWRWAGGVARVAKALITTDSFAWRRTSMMEDLAADLPPSRKAYEENAGH